MIMQALIQKARMLAEPRSLSVARRAFHRLTGSTPPEPDVLFGGDESLFKKLIASATVYGEYGMGKSTRFAIAHTDCKVLAVETSAEYVNSIARELKEDPRLEARHVDVGPVGKWGRPLTYAKRDNFLTYASSIWDRDEKPDFVLVDGRFRVPCFLYSLLHASSGTRIIFDDYVPRPHYHVVEEVLRPVEFCGRQALFVVPESYDKAKAQELLEQFTLVWD